MGAVFFLVTFDEVVDTRHVAVEGSCGEYREAVGDADAQWGLAFLLVVGLLEGVDPRHGREALVVAAVVERFHGCELHRLHLAHHVGGVVTCESGEQRGTETYDGSDLDAGLGELLVAVLEQEPAAHGDREHGSDDPRGGDGVAELVHGERGEGDGGEARHLEAHRVGVELLADGILHPTVGHENPPRRDGGTEA